MFQRAATKRLRHATLPATALVGLLVLGACGGGDGAVSLESTAFDLEEVNNSGYNGEARVTGPQDGPVTLTAVLGRDGTTEGNFPTAIHQGTCEGLSGQQVEDLGEMEGGLLNAEIAMPYDALTEEDHVLVVFESGDRSVYVACGEIA